MKELDIKLNHHNRAFGVGEELLFAVDELREALETGSIETVESKEVSGKVETDNYVIEILPKNKEVTNNDDEND